MPEDKKNNLFLHMKCKHWTREAGGTSCSCAAKQPAFWNENICYIDKDTICPALEVVEPPPPPEPPITYEDVELDDIP